MRALLLACLLAPWGEAQESLSQRISTLRAKCDAQSASATERFELARALQRAGSSASALALAVELTRVPELAPWAHYLVGQLRFHEDPTAAREAFARARDSARALGEPGRDLARQASQAVADSEGEERRGARYAAAERNITLGIWTCALAWMATIGGGLYLTRRRASPAGASR